MKLFSSHVLTAAVISIVVSSAPAWCDVVKHSITISGTIGPGGTLPTSQFKAFDPTLGTLVHISVSLSGTLDYTGKGLPVDEGADFDLEDQSHTYWWADEYFPAVGSGLKFSFDKTDIVNPAVLAEYTGTGLRTFAVNNFGSNLSDHYTFTGSGTVTYEYVAAPPPPPSPLTPWSGSTIRVLTFVVAGPITPPPGTPVEAQLGLADLNGNLIGQLTTVTLVPGQLAWVDLNVSQLVAAGQFVSVRPLITFPVGSPVVALNTTTEIFESQTGIGRVLSNTSSAPWLPPSLAPQGLAGGQMLRMVASAHQPMPCVATLSFADHSGNPVGPVIQADLSPGHSQLLDLDASVLGLQAGQRAEVQPIVTLGTPVNSPDTSSVCSVSSQAIIKASGQTGTYQTVAMQQ